MAADNQGVTAPDAGSRKTSIAEDPLLLECRLLQTFEIGLHAQFIGEIVDVEVEEDRPETDEYPDIKKAKPVMYASSSRIYFGVGEFLDKPCTIGKEYSEA